MKWAHLPVAGGIYDQDPALLEKFTYIFAERAKHDEEEANKRASKASPRNRPANLHRAR